MKAVFAKDAAEYIRAESSDVMMPNRKEDELSA